MKRVKISEKINFIGSWNINDDFLCQRIVDLFEKKKELQQKGVTGSGINEKIKKTTDIYIEPKDLKKDEFKDLKNYLNLLRECYKDYKMQWPFLNKNFKTVDISAFNLQKYEIGGHFADIHCERVSLSNMHRVFAWMTYLNDVDDGGETYFEHFDLKIKPEIGKTLIWPAEWTHAHKGEVLNKGLKYIITGWMHLPYTYQVPQNVL